MADKNVSFIMRLKDRMSGGLRKINNRLTGFNDRIKGMRAGLAAVGIAIGVTVKAIKGMINQTIKWYKTYKVQQKAEETLRNALKNTGREVDENLQKFKKFATQIQKNSNFGDEYTLSLFALASSFDSISDDHLPRLVEAMLGMEAVTGRSAKRGLKTFSKALNDVARNITTFEEAGLKFTEAEKVKIKMLTQTNRELDAQSLVLEKLETQYANQSSAGKDALTQLSNAWGDLGEEIGEQLAPSIESLANDMRVIVEQITKILDKSDGIITFFTIWKNTIKQMNDPLTIFKNAFDAMNKFLENRGKAEVENQEDTGTDETKKVEQAEKKKTEIVSKWSKIRNAHIQESQKAQDKWDKKNELQKLDFHLQTGQKMFGLFKKGQIASMLIGQARAMMDAWYSAPFPFNLGNVALVGAQTGVLLSKARGVELAEGGKVMGSRKGDSIPAVISAGEAVVDAESLKLLEQASLKILEGGTDESPEAETKTIQVEFMNNGETFFKTTAREITKLEQEGIT